MLRDPNKGQKECFQQNAINLLHNIYPLSFCLRDSYSKRLYIAPSALVFELLQSDICVQSFSLTGDLRVLFLRQVFSTFSCTFHLSDSIAERTIPQ